MYTFYGRMDMRITLLMGIGLTCCVAFAAGRQEEGRMQKQEEEKNGTTALDKKRLIVGFQSGVDRESRNQIHHQVGARMILEFVSIAADLVVVTSRLTTAEAVAEYQKQESVRYAEPDQRVHHQEQPGE